MKSEPGLLICAAEMFEDPDVNRGTSFDARKSGKQASFAFKSLVIRAIFWYNIEIKTKLKYVD